MLDVTEYEELASNIYFVLVVHYSGVVFIIATGSANTIEYVSEISFHSLSLVVSVILYSHSFGSTTLMIHGVFSQFFTNEKPFHHLISRECVFISLHQRGIVADQSKTIQLIHSCVQNFIFSVLFNFFPFAYTEIAADIGFTFTVMSFDQSKIQLLLFELLTVRCII